MKKFIIPVLLLCLVLTGCASRSDSDRANELQAQLDALQEKYDALKDKYDSLKYADPEDDGTIALLEEIESYLDDGAGSRKELLESVRQYLGYQ